MVRLNKTTFNGGELSPWLPSRIDIEKYHTGVQIMENMDVVRYGGARGRAGFMYLATAKYDADKECALKGFNFARDDSIMVEFGELYARFYKNGEVVESGGVPYEIITPFLGSEVKQLQFAQRNDVIIITHVNHPPQILSHFDDAEWTISEIPWKDRPWQDLNTTPITLSVAATQGVGIPMTASSSLFTVDDVGKYYRIVQKKEDDVYDFTFDWATNPQNHIPGKNTNDIPVSFNANNDYFTDNANGNTVVKISETGGDKIYRCVQDYSSTAWVDATPYVFDDLVSNGGNVYMCILSLTSSVNDEPGVGANWETYWVLVNDPSIATPYFDYGAIVLDGISVGGKWEFETKNTWIGEWQILRSFDNGVSYQVIKTAYSINDQNFIISDEEDQDSNALFRIVNTRQNFNEQDPVFFRVLSYEVKGEVLVTQYVSPTEVLVNVTKELENTDASVNWSADGFNPYQGYPQTCEFYEERLLFGGVPRDPQTIWFSQTNDYYNFDLGDVSDNDGIKVTLAANSYDGIEWIQSHRTLLVGTSGNLWNLGSAEDASITPGNIRAHPQSALGAEALTAINLNDATVYVQRKGRRLNEVMGDAFSGYLVVDLTELSEHITEGGITQVEKITQPDTRLLCVRSDGQLLIMTYDKQNRISAWFRYVTDGEIESVGTMYGQGEEDEIYIVVKRTLRTFGPFTEDHRYIERLAPDMIRAEDKDIPLDFVYQDSSVIVEGSQMTTITGADHLNNKTVQIIVDGAQMEDKRVIGGTITLDYPADKVVYGLKYVPRMQTMPIEPGQTIGLKKGVNKVGVRLKQSQGAQISQGEGTIPTNIPPRDAQNLTSTPVPVKSTDYEITINNDAKRQLGIEVKQEYPAPLSILSIEPTINVGQ